MAHIEMTALCDFAVRYTAAWCSNDAASVAAFYASHGSLTINGGVPSVGTRAITEAAQGFMTAFPDLRISMDDVVQKDGECIYHWTLEGRNTGPGGTGNCVRISGYEQWTMGDDGLISRSLGNYDAADYARQVERGLAEP